jgi:hypothetical protein
VNRYKSKVDAWLAAIAIGPGVLMVPVMIFATRAGSRIASTCYDVTRESLIVRCGPVRSTIPLTSIRAIKPSRSMSSAPALSLDRLELELDSGRKVLISPLERSAFLSALVRAGVSAAERVPSR